MSSLRTLLLVTLLGFCLNAPLLHAAEPPTLSTVQKALDELPQRKLPEPEQKIAQQHLEQAVEHLTTAQSKEKELAELKQQLEKAPRLIDEAHQALNKLQASPPIDAEKVHAESSLTQLEERLIEYSTQRGEWQKALAEANSQILSAQTRPERAQTEISNNQARAQQINLILKSGRDSNKQPLTAEARLSLNAELAAMQAQDELRRQQLSGNSLLLDLNGSQRDLLSERITRNEQESQAVQHLASEKRRVMSQQTVDQLSQDAAAAGSDQLLGQESANNIKLSDDLLLHTDQLNELNRKNLLVRRQLDSVEQTEQALEEQLSVLSGSLLLNRILHKQKQTLPQVQMDGKLPAQIADLRLLQFQINQQREELGNPQVRVDRLLAEHPEAQLSAQEQEVLLELTRTRSDLLERLSNELNSELNEAINLQLNQNQLLTRVQTVSDTLDEQLFWIPSNPPIDLDWLADLPQQMRQQLINLPWATGVSELGAGLVQRPLVFLPQLLLIGLLLWKRRYLRLKLKRLHQQVGNFMTDNQVHTPMALLLNLLLSVPVALLLALCSYALQLDARGQNLAFSAALLAMAKAWILFNTTYRVLSPGGVAETHFRWPKAQVAFLHQQVRWLGVVVMALVAVATLVAHQANALHDDVLGVIVVLACYLLMAWLLAKLLLKGPSAENAPPLRVFIGLMFTLLPLGLALAVGFGYYYTALKLSDRLIETLYVLLLWILIEAVLVRGLEVAARRLAYHRALRQNEEQPSEDESGEKLQTHNLDLEEINQQSLRLLRLGLFAAFLGSLYWVWADLISVFDYLDNVTLYQLTSATGGTTLISLRNVLAAALIGVITSVLARNLPGLLEVLVLSRLRLAQGSVYATTTLLSYVLIGVGFVATLGTLGVSWDKLQWLVAALSVGIGFGMQEIFANFISGLIILFERPVRIGDLVTIGGVTGTVKRIHIRATHIVDSDRKEVIVPNKTFVTGQVINWTLSDTVTRVVLTIGVNRGADLEKVRSLLLQATHENARVMRDPAPTAQVTAYSPTSLTHELKLYVRELADRGPATDELNRRIDQLLSENNINISGTPKMEVFLHNNKGEQQPVTPAASTVPAPAS
jgi:potassium efflux system protein